MAIDGTSRHVRIVFLGAAFGRRQARRFAVLNLERHGDGQERADAVDMRSGFRRHWQLRGHPVEVAIITIALSAWPYLTFVRLIAPLIDDRRSHQFYPEVLPYLVVGLVVLMLLQLCVWRSSSTPRYVCNGIAAILNIVGIVDCSLIEPEPYRDVDHFW